MKVKCPKCGNDNIAWFYCDGIRVKWNSPCAMTKGWKHEEHHTLHCRRCSYEWEIPIGDYGTGEVESEENDE